MLRSRGLWRRLGASLRTCDILGKEKGLMWFWKVLNSEPPNSVTHNHVVSATWKSTSINNSSCQSPLYFPSLWLREYLIPRLKGTKFGHLVLDLGQFDMSFVFGLVVESFYFGCHVWAHKTEEEQRRSTGTCLDAIAVLKLGWWKCEEVFRGGGKWKESWEMMRVKLIGRAGILGMPCVLIYREYFPNNLSLKIYSSL